MYTKLPKNQKEFEDMVNYILDGYEKYKVSDELVLRMRVDINYLFKESGLDIIDDELEMKIRAYKVERDTNNKELVNVEPVWEPI